MLERPLQPALKHTVATYGVHQACSQPQLHITSASSERIPAVRILYRDLCHADSCDSARRQARQSLEAAKQVRAPGAVQKGRGL